MRPPHSYALAILYASIVFAANTDSPTAPRQPAQSGTVGTFQVGGDSIVSGQQVRDIHVMIVLQKVSSWYSSSSLEQQIKCI